MCPHMLFANETRAETRAHVREPAPTVRSFATAACSSDTMNTSCSPVICVKSNASKRNEYGEEQHDLKTVPGERTGRKKCNGRWRSEIRIVCSVVCESSHSLSRPKIPAPHLSLPYLSLTHSLSIFYCIASSRSELPRATSTSSLSDSMSSFICLTFAQKERLRKRQRIKQTM
jgi:hypothetical protein